MLSDTAISVIVAALVIFGIAVSVDQYFFHEPYNPAFRQFPAIVMWHVILGLAYLAGAPLQFVSRIRDRHIDYHRWAGRVLFIVGCVVGFTALFIGIFIPFSGWWERVVIGVFGSFFVLALVKAFVHIRAKRVVPHREWMIRAFSIALGIASMRVIYATGLIIQGKSIHTPDALLSVAAFTAAFVIHAVVAEAWIRRSRGGQPTAT